MARIELPSGAWVEYRDQLKVRDRFEVQEVARLEISDSGNKASFLAMQNDMRNALLGRIITAWSYTAPVPAQDPFHAADVILGEVMDLDDYAALEEAVQPLMDKISGRVTPKKPPSASEPSSGLRRSSPGREIPQEHLFPPRDSLR